MKEKLKFILGLTLLTLLGFLAYCVVTGFGVIIAFIFVLFPVWQILLGTILGSVGVFLYLIKEQ